MLQSDNSAQLTHMIRNKKDYKFLHRSISMKSLYLKSFFELHVQRPYTSVDILGHNSVTRLTKT